MVIAIFGESCTGKSTIAEALAGRLDATVYSGRDYLRLAKNEQYAEKLFAAMLAEQTGKDGCIVCVFSEKEQLRLIPDGALRVLVTAELDVIRERFAKRLGRPLPPPLAASLERKHGAFDNEPHDVHVTDGEATVDQVCEELLAVAKGLA